MKNKKPAVVLIIIFLLIGLAGIGSEVKGTYWSLFPPLLAILVAFMTSHLALSLGSAVILGSFFIEWGQAPSSLKSIWLTGSRVFDYGTSSLLNWTNLQILAFVFCVLTMIHVIQLARGLEAIVSYLQRWVVGPKSAQFVTALMGCLLFIDDYANTMVVGTTMRTMTDKFKVSRAKLAFLVDATSAPIAGIALVSTWIGYEVGLFAEMSSQYAWPLDGYGVFLEALQFRYYCYFMIIFVFVNIFFFDFGPMTKAKPLSHNKEPIEAPLAYSLAQALCAIIPITLLLGLIFILLWWDGGGFAPEMKFWSLGDWRMVLTRSQNGTTILFVSSLVSYLVSNVLAVLLAKISWQVLKGSLLHGLKSAGMPTIILILAWSMKNLCDDFETGQWVVQALGPGLASAWLPVLIFLISFFMAFAIGSSWGTMAILIPTVTPLALSMGNQEYGIFIALCLAAILDGAIFGDHCSPISDTTIMSCISTECDLIEHVKTQLPYSLLVATLAIFVGYIPAGFALAGSEQSAPPLWLTLLLTFALLVGLFLFLGLYRRMRKERSL